MRLRGTERPGVQRRREGGWLGWYTPYALGAFGLAAAIGLDLVPARALLEGSIGSSPDAAPPSLARLGEARPGAGEGERIALGQTEVTHILPATAGVVVDMAELDVADDEAGPTMPPEANPWPGTPAAVARTVRHDDPFGAVASSHGRHGAKAARLAFNGAFDGGGERAAHRRGRTSRATPNDEERAAESRAVHAERQSLTPTLDALLPSDDPEARELAALEPSADDAPTLAPDHRRARGGKARSVSAGQSCEAAVAAYSESMVIGGAAGPPDLSAGSYGAVLDRGSYFQHCGAPANMRIHICAAVQQGRAVGVTVRTEPGDRAVGRCVARAVRGLSFPSHPRLDVARTTFEAR